MSERFHLHRIFLEILERRQIRAQSLVEWQVLEIGHVLVAVVFEILREYLCDGEMYVRDMRCCTGDVLACECLGDAVCLESVFGCFLNETEGCHGAEKMLEQPRGSTGLVDEVLMSNRDGGRIERAEDVEIEADLDERPAKRLSLLVSCDDEKG